MDSRNLNLGPHAYMAGTFTNMSQLSRPTYKCFVFFLPLKKMCAMCVTMGQRGLWVCHGQRTTLWYQFSPSAFMWIPGNHKEVRLSSKHFNCWASSHLPMTGLEEPTFTSENGQYCLVLTRAAKCSQENRLAMYYLRMRSRDKGLRRSVQPCSILSWMTLRPLSA